MEQVVLSGYTPYPRKADDERLPHETNKVHNQIHKTALGAEDLVSWQQNDDIDAVIGQLKRDGYRVFALEQTEDATSLPGFRPPYKLALVVGREVEGLEPEVIAMCDGALEIPMSGRKESFNVAVAAAMALYDIMLNPG